MLSESDNRAGSSLFREARPVLVTNIAKVLNFGLVTATPAGRQRPDANHLPRVFSLSTSCSRNLRSIPNSTARSMSSRASSYLPCIILKNARLA